MIEKYLDNKVIFKTTKKSDQANYIKNHILDIQKLRLKKMYKLQKII